MLIRTVLKLFSYVCYVLKGLLEIFIGKEEFIYDDSGNIISKLPSKRKRKQMLIFAKNFLKEPVSWILLKYEMRESFLKNLTLRVDFNRQRF